MSDTQSTAEATPTAVPAFGGNASTVSALRPDEFFVINHVARTYSGNWRPGENPPDAYLKLHNKSIAVEISTLVQHVQSVLNQSRSRYSDDESALRIIQEIKDAIPAFLLNGRTVILTLSPPIKKFRQTRNQLELAVRNELLTNNDVDTNVEIHGNEISIQIKSYGEPADATVVGAVMHRTSSPDILQNTRFSLENMIGVKSDKCAALTPPIWLALLNDYWLADPATYRQAMKMLSVTHPFVKILLVSGNGLVTELFSQ